MILDNLRVHHGKPVKARLAAPKERIEPFILPGCRQDLPSEGIATVDLKQSVGSKARARTKTHRV